MYLNNERFDQIKELENWANSKQEYIEITPQQAILFFYQEKKEQQGELEQITKFYNELVAKATSKFNIGKYTAKEYAITIILKKIDNNTLEELKDQNNEDTGLIHPTLSNNAKISYLQKLITSIINDENEGVTFQFLVTKLTESRLFNESEAKDSINKYLKIGAIIKNEHDKISI